METPKLQLVTIEFAFYSFAWENNQFVVFYWENFNWFLSISSQLRKQTIDESHYSKASVNGIISCDVLFSYCFFHNFHEWPIIADHGCVKWLSAFVFFIRNLNSMVFILFMFSFHFVVSLWTCWKLLLYFSSLLEFTKYLRFEMRKTLTFRTAVSFISYDRDTWIENTRIRQTRYIKCH